MRRVLCLCLALGSALGFGQSGLWVDLGAYKSAADTHAKTDAAMRQFTSNFNVLTKLQRERSTRAGRYDDTLPLSIPMTVRLSSNGNAYPPVKKDPGDIVLVFDASGASAFPTAYRDLLQSVFDKAKPTLNVVFGIPASGGNVLVKNYDATMADRDAVSGGYFLPNNGAGQREIRFPVYTSPEAAAVNFVHCLLLAYIGPSPYGFDAFQEGLVRAATMKIVRTANALPANLDAGQIAAVLENTYDVGSFYDWYNQRALGGKQFVAPNLRDTQLPPGGSLGGIYLLRYQMAGSAWQKLVAENGGFIAEMNRRFYLNPGAGSDVNQLVAIGQAALDTVKGAANSRVENQLFGDWLRRQYILETKDTRGPKLLVQPIPISSGLGGTDFGVFDVSATYFETQAGGNEILLSGTAYPMFWDQAFNRVFPSAQEDVMPIAAAYGSVTPNLPDINGGQQYRCTVDIPVADRIARAYLPAGSIATAANPTPNTFYGTVIGMNLPFGATAKVKLTVGGTVLAQPAVRNGAFGAKVDVATFMGYARIKVEVIQSVGATDTVLLTRFINKGPGELGLDLRVGGDVNYSLPGGLLKGIQMVGLPVDPWVSAASDLLGIPENQVLLARYDPTQVAYDLYPDTGGVLLGNGYFVRMDAAKALTVPGRSHVKTPVAVALRPGWNMVTTPLNETVVTSRVLIIKTAQAPVPFADAAGIDIGTDFFAFQRGANDPASGAPETGTMVKATQFDPGKAYFVRVLAPEGVSLLFFPNNFAPKPGQGFAETGWRLRAGLTAGPIRTEAVVGQSQTGTKNFDRREDSGIPPRIGGIQMYIESGEAQFKDVRRVYVGETYKVRIDGLTKDKTYTVDFAKLLGSPPQFVVKDKVWLTTKTLTAPATFTFKAKSASHRLDVLVYGGGQ